MLNDPFLVALAKRLAKVGVVLAELNGLMAGKQCEREPATCFQCCEASAEASACSVAWHPVDITLPYCTHLSVVERHSNNRVAAGGCP